MTKAHKFFSIFFFTIVFLMTHLPQSRAKVSSEGEVTTLPVMVITATKIAGPLNKATASVSVIDSKTIEEKHLNTVLDALRAVPGLDIVQTGGPGGTTSAFLRGGNSQHTLVLIDGVQVNSPTLGQYNFANLTTENVDRIEIIRGPQSTLYGSDAIGGVIQIFTKKGVGAFSGNISLEGGSFGSYRETVRFSGANDHLDYSFSAARFDTEGFSRAAGKPEQDGYENTSLSSKIGLRLSEQNVLDLSIRYSHSKAELDESFPLGDNKAIQKNDTLSSAVSFSSQVTNDWNLKLQFGFQEEESEGKDPVPGFNNFRIDTQSQQYDLQNNIKWGRANQLVAGYEYEIQEGKNKGTFDKTLTNGAEYFLNQTQMESLILNLGLRFDHNKKFGDETTYKIEVATFIDSTESKLRAAFGTGFHGPTLNDLFFPGFGNDKLKPEQSRSFELGLDQKFKGETIQFTATYFHTQIKDMIVFVSDPITFLGMPENIQEAKITGWEIGANWMISRGLTLSIDYTLTDTENISTGKELARRPKHKGNGGLRLSPSDQASIILDLIYVGERFNDTTNATPLGGYTTVNLAGTYEISKSIQIFTRVINLFDRNYEEVTGFGTAGFSGYGGLKLSF